MITNTEFFQVQDNAGYRGHPNWHAASVGPGILCDVVRSGRAKPSKWRDGTDRVNCTACLAISIRPDTSVTRRSVYELVTV